MFLAGVGYSLGQVNVPQVVLCVLASQIANFGESLIGATLQDKEGFEWMNNDVVNVLNISAGAILAVLMQWFLGCP
ncbi:protein VTE6, chloroplastic-like [Lolium rigidum]|uniref:protein VTE6, chloroplastic-like n=1 Tax=Lolium rigidum TaxID=89674 RepID=UPI001F5E3268|nr:protein VTE6, chloroplastic-like [Lolium rigidum]